MDKYILSPAGGYLVNQFKGHAVLDMNILCRYLCLSNNKNLTRQELYVLVGACFNYEDTKRNIKEAINYFLKKRKLIRFKKGYYNIDFKRFHKLLYKEKEKFTDLNGEPAFIKRALLSTGQSARLALKLYQIDAIKFFKSEEHKKWMEKERKRIQEQYLKEVLNERAH